MFQPLFRKSRGARCAFGSRQACPGQVRGIVNGVHAGGQGRYSCLIGNGYAAVDRNVQARKFHLVGYVIMCNRSRRCASRGGDGDRSNVQVEISRQNVFGCGVESSCRACIGYHDLIGHHRACCCCHRFVDGQLRFHYGKSGGYLTEPVFIVRRFRALLSGSVAVLGVSPVLRVPLWSLSMVTETYLGMPSRGCHQPVGYQPAWQKLF